MYSKKTAFFLIKKALLPVIVGALAFSSLPSITVWAKKNPKTERTCQKGENRQGCIVRTAREYLGVKYKWGGRTREELDCLGLLFLALRHLNAIEKWSVMPSELINQLVENGGNRTDYLLKDNKIPALERGTVILFLDSDSHEDTPVFNGLSVWHVGIATENGNFIHASPFSPFILQKKVMEEPLGDFIKSTGFKGFVAIRF